MKPLFRTLVLFVALLPFACAGCSAVQPKVSSLETATIQTDAGPMVCKYVQLSAQGQTANVGICAADTEQLDRAVALVDAVYPLAKEAIQNSAKN